MAVDPFAPEELARLLESDAARPTLLKRRESKTLELKANFSLSDDAKVDYARTMAAFSNREGGYLMFGIRDKPHEKDGMQNSKLDELDPRVLSQFLQNHFSPNIDWEHRVHEVDGKRFGFIYVWPAKRKPVVCIAANSKGKTLRDGDVFYRYQGETKLIGSSELHGLIEERIEQERRLWQNLLKTAAHLTPPSVAFLDFQSGRLTGAEGTLMIGEELLDKVKFIQEGRLDESGEPTLNVVGDVHVAPTVAIPVDRAVPVDPSARCDLWESEAIKSITDRIGGQIKWGDSTKSMTSPMFRDVIAAYGIDSPSPMMYIPQKAGSRKQYGDCLADWMVEQYTRDHDFFWKANHHVRRRGHTAEGDFATPGAGRRDVELDHELGEEGG